MSTAPAMLERRLRHRRTLGFLALLFERLWVAVWPALGVCGLFVCLALLGLPPLLPPVGQCALLAAFGLAAATLLWRGLAGLRTPGRAEVDRRLEHDSGLAHRPLAALADRPVAVDAFGARLWELHLYRSAAQLARLRVGRPRPGLARIDRHALRGALVVALAACVGIAGTDAPRRLWAALTPTLPRAAAAPATELQAWITPPAYTGLAPIFLKPGPEDAVPLRVPTGSRLVVSVTGGQGDRPSLDLGGQQAAFTALAAGSFQAGLGLTHSGLLHVRRAGDTLARWRIDVLPDLPPTAAWAAPPGPARAALHTALPWKASDDYGVTKLVAELRLKARPEAPPIVVPIPLSGGKQAHGRAEPDLSANPWAGLPVVARLVAHDAIGQQGVSADAAFTLPERQFRNPEARKLIAIRKGLSLHPDDRDAALAGLDALMVQPGSIGKDPSAYVNLAGIYYLLEFDRAAAAVPEAQRRLWKLALYLEEGAAARSEQALQSAMRAAQDALSALRANPDAAHRRALEQKLQALEQAIARHMQALARQYRNAQLPQAAKMQPGTARLTRQELERLAQQALQAARQGNTQQAEQAMARLQQMLDALRQAHPMTARDRARQAAQRKARQQMNVMQDLLNREGGVLNHTQERRQEAARADAMHRAAPDQKAGRAQDEAVQKALRRALGEVMQQIGELTGKVPDGLGKADQAMEGAAKALGAGKDDPAEQSEMQAIQDLQKGGRQAAQQLARKFGGGQQGQGAQGQQGGAFLTRGNGSGQEESAGSFGQSDGGQRGLDPLGRRAGSEGNGYDESNDVKVPERAGPKRTEAIQRELRRRDAQRTRPQLEREYIQRLLKQF